MLKEGLCFTVVNGGVHMRDIGIVPIPIVALGSLLCRRMSLVSYMICLRVLIIHIAATDGNMNINGIGMTGIIIEIGMNTGIEMTGEIMMAIMTTIVMGMIIGTGSTDFSNGRRKARGAELAGRFLYGTSPDMNYAKIILKVIKWGDLR
jgi:hypothetical protein